MQGQAYCIQLDHNFGAGLINDCAGTRQKANCAIKVNTKKFRKVCQMLGNDELPNKKDLQDLAYVQFDQFTEFREGTEILSDYGAEYFVRRRNSVVPVPWTAASRNSGVYGRKHDGLGIAQPTAH